MPISSSEIAAMNGAFQGQAMNNLAYAGMIGQGANVYGGGYQGQSGDRAMGGAMNMASSVGAPLAAGAMGMMGLDPLSMGMKAGMGAFGSGAGMAGSMALGGAVALPMMAAGAAVSYAGGQMMTGAHQQQDLNSQLRGGYNFRNPYGGQGFTRSDMSSIGSVVREMSDQFGPGGEIASFKELSGLAGKMGSMGFAQGVKDVKDFTSRFKEMVKTLKGMATELGTTLEGAMEFAQAAKSSGVFGMHRAQSFTAAARSTAYSGGLALSEVTGAASVGSQISRSIGGLGRQGAGAGMRTIGQIGTAQQMGILSEEDIYNVTGQTGAEGRQAYAASAMQGSAKFLQSGRGRRMLASMAGKDGTLDETAVQQFLSGGMGIGETMANDRSHVTGAGAPVNRANFIRNEGRLRGAAMERLGGFLPAMQMMQWASSKGIDINNMDDRSMLFAQRQLGMGRDEVDQAVKMAQNMPAILRQQQSDTQADHYFQQLATSRKGQGVQGVQQRFEQAKEQINSKLQKVGQDIYNTGSEQIDSFFNKLFGTYVQTYSKDIDSNTRQMLRGGAMGQEAGSRAFGIGKGGLRSDFAKLGGGTGLGGSGQEDLAAAMGHGARSMVGQILFGESGVSQLKRGGINISGMNSAQITATLQTARATQLAAATGFDPTAIDAAKGGDFLSQAYAMKDMGKGLERQQNVVDLINKQAQGDPSDRNTIAAKAMQSQIAAAKGDPTKIAALIGNYERAQKVDTAAQLGTLGGLGGIGGEQGMASLLAKQGTGGFGSSADESKAYANALGIRGFGPNGEGRGGRALMAGGAALAGAALGSLLGPLGTMAGGALGARIGAGIMSAPTEWEKQAGAYAKSEQFRNTVSSLFSNDKTVAAAAKVSLRQEIQKQAGEQTTGDIAVKRNLLAGMDYLDFMDPSKHGGKAPSAEEQEKWLKDKQALGQVPEGATIEGIKGALGGARDVLEQRQRVDRDEADRRQKVASGKAIEGLRAAGVTDDKGQITGASLKALGGAGSKAAAYAQAMLKQEQMLAAGGISALDSPANAKAVQDNAAMLAGLTVEQKRQVAATMGGSIGAEAGYEASLQHRLMRPGRGGQRGAIAGMLGTGLKGDDLKGLDDQQAAAKMLQSMGVDIGSSEGKAILGQLKGALGEKDKGKAAHELAGIMDSPAVQEAKKKKDAAQQESENPLAARQAKAAEQTNNYLKALIGLTQGGNELLAQMDKKDAEGK